jgi:hypothetical protein
LIRRLCSDLRVDSAAGALTLEHSTDQQQPGEHRRAGRRFRHRADVQRFAATGQIAVVPNLERAVGAEFEASRRDQAGAEDRGLAAVGGHLDQRARASRVW